MHHFQPVKLNARGVAGDWPYLHMIAAVGAPSDQFERTDNATEHDVVNLDWMEDALLRNGTSEQVAGSSPRPYQSLGLWSGPSA